MDDIRVAEMFAGIGGFRLGLERAGGFKVVWANECDKYACQVYRKHFGDAELAEKDIREVKTDSVPDFDVLTAGFPCPTFSIAGRRKGIGDSRGALFTQIVRFASSKRPRVLFLENVRGLLSSSNGRDFAVILRTLGGLGYILQWECVDSKYFGVAQTRERTFIIGHLGKERFRKIFPLGEDAGGDGTSLGEAQGKGKRLRGNNLPNSVVANTISSRYGKDGSENLIQLNDDGGSQVNRIYSPMGLSPTVPTACGGGHIPKISTCVDGGEGSSGPGTALRYVRTEKAKKVRAESMRNGRDYTPFGKGFRTLQECVENVAGAVTGALNRDTLVATKHRPRRLTPMECERLQGFPDGWTDILSDTQRYKCLGNAVTVNVIHHIGARIKESWND